MNIVALTLKVDDKFRIDCRELLPENLCALNAEEIAQRKILIGSGATQKPISELFDISVEPAESVGESCLKLHNTNTQLHHVGAGMSGGRILVSGDVGDYVGHGLNNGEVIVNGNAGDFVGSGQADGLIHIKGSVGNYAGGAADTEMQGLKGGTLVISGTSGQYLGYKMRRGIIVAQDSVAEHCANNMIAGTIILGNQCGAHLGLGMRRGTVIFLEKTEIALPTFNLCGSFSLPFLTVLRHHLHSINHHAAMRLAKIRTVRRFCGDLGYDGQGEVLIAN
ncbi:MAG: formylmethanofuran dehydrogenase subunit C [Gammaproteobacteria bacterium]